MNKPWEAICALEDYHNILQDWIKSAAINPADPRQKTIIHLKGPMGVGKSTLGRKILELLEQKTTSQGSPTFAIVHEYTHIVHIDLYRVKNSTELQEKGLLYYLWENPKTVMIEWLNLFPELEESLRQHYSLWVFELSILSNTTRRLSIQKSPKLVT